jgi:enoyl-CoA hydratase/carnithine racemase
MTQTATILTARQDGIFIVTLNRPERMNAFTAEMKDELLAALDEADADDGVQAVVFTGAGDRAFCAGADLAAGGASFDYSSRLGESSMFRADGSVDYSHPLVRDAGGEVTGRIFAARKPVIGAINGVAVGVGATLALPMDFRLASETARFGFVFARRGIVPESASSWYLPRLVGISKALEWCYSGRIFPAAEAQAAGLVRSIHAPGKLLDDAIAFARELTAESAPVSIALTRHMLWRMMGASHPNVAHRWDSRLVFERGRSADAAEGVSSFLEKRPASYPNSVAREYPFFPEFDADPDYS